MLNLLDIFVIAVAMSIDAFCVSLCVGMRFHSLKHYLRLGAAFGFFQFMMPLIGSWAGKIAMNYTSHLCTIAALILMAIAFKMAYDGYKHKECEVYTSDPTTGLTLIGLAVATSIDALGAGVSVAVTDVNILFASSIIGVVCMFFSFFGVAFGQLSSRYIGHYANYFGGFVLFLISIKLMIL